MSDKYQIQGEIIHVGEVETFDSGFTKRIFAIRTDGEYAQEVGLEVVKDKCSMLDPIQLGERVTVSFNIRGREYEGRYYVNLSAWRIERESAAGASPSVEVPHPASTGHDTGDDNMPF